ncbi:hypothetical protein HanXRQr2_Chr13g0616371 [Helianthus annuus]|uniref:Uncharacterized protein n=1 Tax=Helianthus annuus TaxID=4232 RepID=A0A9K3HD10_HELAN|nr:hypothetical protein HanXRQr2_Chr13g0616371 [Helianthus annuus]
MNSCDRLLHFPEYYTTKIFINTAVEDPLACHWFKFPASLKPLYEQRWHSISPAAVSIPVTPVRFDCPHHHIMVA